jgi:hypothetical protein
MSFLWDSRQPVGKETEDIIGIRHQAKNGEDIGYWKDFMCAVVTGVFGVCNSVRLS